MHSSTFVFELRHGISNNLTFWQVLIRTSLQMVFSQYLNNYRILKRLAKALIRLCVCAGWSEALLVAHTTLLEISCTGSFICYDHFKPIKKHHYLTYTKRFWLCLWDCLPSYPTPHQKTSTPWNFFWGWGGGESLNQCELKIKGRVSLH